MKEAYIVNIVTVITMNSSIGLTTSFGRIHKTSIDVGIAKYEVDAFIGTVDLHIADGWSSEDRICIAFKCPDSHRTHSTPRDCLG